jgi:hypothetical protein
MSYVRTTPHSTVAKENDTLVRTVRYENSLSRISTHLSE